VISGLVAIVGTIQVVFASLALPWWLWLTLAFVALVIAQYLAFHDVRMERDRAREEFAEARVPPGPRLLFGLPYVRSGINWVDENQDLETASVAVVPIRNEGAEDALSVVVWLSVRSLDGSTPHNLKDAKKAHWADSHVAGQRSITIPANRDDYAIDLVLKIQHENACWLFDDETPRVLRREGNAIEAREFYVAVVARAAGNHPEIRSEVRIRRVGDWTGLEIVDEQATAQEPPEVQG